MVLVFFVVIDLDGQRDPSPGTESSDNMEFFGSNFRNDIVCNSVSDVFVESVMVSEAVEVELERLGFDAAFAGDVLDLEMSCVGLPGDGAERAELWTVQLDPVGAAGSGIREGL